MVIKVVGAERPRKSWRGEFDVFLRDGPEKTTQKTDRKNTGDTFAHQREEKMNGFFKKHCPTSNAVGKNRYFGLE